MCHNTPFFKLTRGPIIGPIKVIVIFDEMLEILAIVSVEQPILEASRLSHAAGLEVDESTDVSLTRQLDIHIRY